MGVIFTYMKFLDYRGIFTSLRSLDYWDNFHIPSPQMSCPKKNSESSSVLVWACVHLQLNSQPAPRYRTIPILLWHLLISNTFYSGWEAPSLKMGSVFCFVLFVCLFVCLLFFFFNFFFFWCCRFYTLNSDWPAAWWHVLCCLTHCLMAHSIVGLLSFH